MNCCHYITFRLAGDVYAFPVSRVCEVVELEPLARVPDAPACVRGLLDLRGQPLLVFDLRRRLGFTEASDGPDSRIMVLETERAGSRLHLGAVADAVLEVVELSGEGLRTTPALGATWRSDAVVGVGNSPSGRFLVLDVDHVLHGTAVAGLPAELPKS